MLVTSPTLLKQSRKSSTQLTKWVMRMVFRSGYSFMSYGFMLPSSCSLKDQGAPLLYALRMCSLRQTQRKINVLFCYLRENTHSSFRLTTFAPPLFQGTKNPIERNNKIENESIAQTVKPQLRQWSSPHHSSTTRHSAGTHSAWAVTSCPQQKNVNPGQE